MNNSMHDGTFLSPQNFYPGLDLSLGVQSVTVVVVPTKTHPTNQS